ncbi:MULTISPECIES: MFS transporter [unclassified Tatumella]|uniref:MFS transporter n=1 Tax=unclassified Tatumella TaxID=2649542 RepID=UPI001BB0BE50|nr:MULTISPECIES: MFS transporter [unclassified Tatumella]MBS0876132.1 MFS transporter [Tatumella sp. JGM82]MBS0889180.1 MFS transporter [Tatumella sp. JGM94]MBS0901062.1 MFS transporter [Tatumella sp. JGM100]
MISWKKNLLSLWLGCFITGLGTSQILPFLPLYISQLGNYDTASLTLWSGLTFSITFLISAIVSPLWGRMADSKGRKLMLIRAAVGMAIAIFFQGMVTSVWQLFLLRGLMGLASGYIPNAMALIASQVPKGKSGWALSILSTAQISGFLGGPLLGGYLADHVGLRPVFHVTTLLLVLTTLVTLFFIKEQPRQKSENKIRTKPVSVWKTVPSPSIILCLLFCTLVVQLCNGSVNPILFLYVQHLAPDSHNIAFMSGFIAALPGMSALISAPVWGRMSDNIGPKRIISVAFVMFIILLTLMSLVSSVPQFSVLRFLLGFADGAMFPAIQTMLLTYSSAEVSGRVFGYNQSFMNLGNVTGPLLGSVTSAVLGMRWVFLASAIVILINLIYLTLTFRTAQRAASLVTRD